MTIVELDPFNGTTCTVKTADDTYYGVLSYDDPLLGINIDSGSTVWTIDAESILAVGQADTVSPYPSISFSNLIIIGLVLFLLFQGTRRESY